MAVTLGCFTRPWGAWDLGTAVAGAAAAGFEALGLMRFQKRFLLSDETPIEDAERIGWRIREGGLDPLVALASLDMAAPADEALDKARRFLDRARAAGARVLLLCGTSDPTKHEDYVELLRGCAPEAAQRGMRLALKPHGGISATADLCRAVLDQVGHDALEIWHDPGNVIYYTGQDPVADVKRIAASVKGVCVKDCSGGRQGDVAITPGTGEVDFDAYLRTLLEAGFDGPLVVECLGGETIEQVDAEAVKAVQFLRETLARIGA